MEHQFFIRQQNLKLYRSLVAASEAAKRGKKQRITLLVRVRPGRVCTAKLSNSTTWRI